MPPKRKPENPLKQTSIKDMIASKRVKVPSVPDPVEKLSKRADPISLPNCLQKHTNIRPPFYFSDVKDATYSTTSFARTWFRNHSNVDDLTKKCIEAYPETKRHALSALNSSVIKAAISSRHRQLFHPYNEFKFESHYDEAVGKELLMNPNIQSDEDFETFQRFYKSHGLQLILISMPKNNPVLEDANHYVELKRRRMNDSSVRVSKSKMNYYIERRNYERQGLIEEFNLFEIDSEKLMKISNFGQVVKTTMKELGLDKPENFQVCADNMFELWKKTPCIITENRSFYVYPRYNLCVNNFTDEELTNLAQSYDDFHRKTNSTDILSYYLETRNLKRFFEIFCASSIEDRRKPPFNMLAKLIFNRDNSEREESSDENEKENEVVSLKYKAPVRTATTVVEEEVVLSDDDDRVSSDRASIVTVFEHKIEPAEENTSSPQDSLNKTQKETSIANQNGATNQSIPQQFLKISSLPSDDLIPVLQEVMINTVFITEAEKMLRRFYSLNFDQLWKGKKNVIISQFVSFLWEEKEGIELIILIIDECPLELQEKVNPYLFARQSKLNQQGGQAESIVEDQFELCDDQIASELEKSNEEQVEELVQEQQIPDQPEEFVQQPKQTEEDPLKIGTGSTQQNSPQTSVQIKRELISQSLNDFSNFSEVICLGTPQLELVDISDSEDEDESMIAALNDQANPKTSEENTFLKQINEGTQSDEMFIDVEVPPILSDETMKRIECFVPESARIEVREKEIDKALKEKTNQNNSSAKQKRVGIAKPCPRSRKTIRQQSGIQYVDSEDSGNEEGEKIHRALNDDFSVFLSSQLIDIELPPEQPTINEQPIPFTFVQSSSSLKPQPSTNQASESTCFISQLCSVNFEKNVKFDIHVNFPQYNLYDVILRGDSIQPLLNIKPEEYDAILSLLNLIEKYEYVSTVTRSRSSSSFIIDQLDLFFSSLVKLRTFNLITNSQEHSCVDVRQTASSNVILTSAISKDVLDRMES